MIRLNNTKQQPVIVYNAPIPDSETGRRFIVPVTNPEADPAVIARRVWELANVASSRVLFLGLCDDARQEPSLRRILATASAMVNYGNVSAESEIRFGRNLVEAVRSRVQKGDTVVCWQEQHKELLQANLAVPIYLIPEVRRRQKQLAGLPNRLAAWAGSIAIIVFFFFLQVEIDHLADGWVTVLQLLSVAGEFGMILFWNNLFG